MSVVRINAISVPPGAGPQLEGRFAERAKAVDGQPGFEGFELLRPTEGEDRYFVITHWADAASFDSWVASKDFAHGHQAKSPSDGDASGPPDGSVAEAKPGASQPPVSMGAELLSFDVVDLGGD